MKGFAAKAAPTLRLRICGSLYSRHKKAPIPLGIGALLFFFKKFGFKLLGYKPAKVSNAGKIALEQGFLPRRLAFLNEWQGNAAINDFNQLDTSCRPKRPFHLKNQSIELAHYINTPTYTLTSI